MDRGYKLNETEISPIFFLKLKNKYYLTGDV